MVKGYFEEQDIRTRKSPKHQAAAKKPLVNISNAEIKPRPNVQDIVYNRYPGFLEKAIKTVTIQVDYYAKNNSFIISSIDKDVSRVPLKSIRPTQFGEDYKNDSSEHQAKSFKKVLNGAEHDRDEDYYPLVVDRITGLILDGNHRHYALSAN